MSRNRTVKIMNADREICGVGFYIDKKRILTCFHVVKKAQENSPDILIGYSRKSVEHDDTLTSAKILNPKYSNFSDVPETDLYKKHDLALLEAVDDIKPDILSSALVSYNNSAGRKVSCYGYPEGYENGKTETGEIYGTTEHPAYEFVPDVQKEKPDEHQSYWVTYGFSGGPVFYNDDIIGMIQFGSTGENRAYFSSLHQILKIIPEIKNSVRRFIELKYGHVSHLLEHLKKKIVDKRDGGICFDIRIQRFDSFLELKEQANKLDSNYEGDELTACFAIENIFSRNGSNNFDKIFLQAHAGSGKSSFLAELIDKAVDNEIVPFFLDIAKKANDSTLIDTMSPTQSPGEYLFDNFAISGDYHTFKKYWEDDGTGPDKILLVIDGLNERANKTPDIINAIDKFTSNTHAGVRIIVADRLTERNRLEGFKLFGVPPLPKEVIMNSFSNNERFSKETGWLNLLSNSFFLNLTLQLQAVGDDSQDSLTVTPDKITILDNYLITFLGISSDDLQKLSNTAFSVYKDFGSIRFNTSYFRESLKANDLDEKLFDTAVEKGVIIKAQEEGDVFQFRHQLIHDFLVGRYLASQDPGSWRIPFFDACTLKANSTDVLDFALMMSKGEPDKFLIEVYDWNYMAALDCIINYNNQISERIPKLSLQLVNAIFAIHTEKLFDSFSHTKGKIEEKTNLFQESSVIHFHTFTTRLELISAISSYYDCGEGSTSDYYTNWKDIFTKQSALEKKDLAWLFEDPLLSWTAANVYKRKLVSPDIMYELHFLYNVVNKTGENNPKSNTAKWRIVHTLGSCNIDCNYDFLFNILCNTDENYWVRYGAVRSFVEAISHEHCRQVRKEQFVRLQPVINKIAEKPLYLTELRRIKDLNRAQLPESWEVDYNELFTYGFENINWSEGSKEKKEWKKIYDKIKVDTVG